MNIGSPSDLIPIAWYNFWNKMNEAGSMLQLIHMSNKNVSPIIWRLVFKAISPSGNSYYGIWTDSNYKVLKHIGTNDINDIKLLFDLPDLNANNNINVLNLKAALLHNSPIIPNPDYNSGLQN